MRFLLRFLALLVVLVVASGFLLVARINTESNKAVISEAVVAATGLELTIGGDLSLSLFPNLSLSLTDVRLRNPFFPQELASTSSAVLSVEPTPLLRGQIKIREISTADLHVNYFIDANGTSIWSTGAAEPGAASRKPSSPGELTKLPAFRSTDCASATPASTFRMPQSRPAIRSTTSAWTVRIPIWKVAPSQWRFSLITKTTACRQPFPWR